MERTVTLDDEVSFEDYGLLGEGLVKQMHCNKCGAEIIVYQFDDGLTWEERHELNEEDNT